MVGMIIPSDGGLVLHQLFAREYEEEPAVLEETLARLDGARAVVTYNGKRFDMPSYAGAWHTTEGMTLHRLP